MVREQLHIVQRDPRARGKLLLERQGRQHHALARGGGRSGNRGSIFVLLLIGLLLLLLLLVLVLVVALALPRLVDALQHCGGVGSGEVPADRAELRLVLGQVAQQRRHDLV